MHFLVPQVHLSLVSNFVSIKFFPMDLSRTQLSGLLNNVQHEKTRFVNILYRLKSILSLFKGNKLILNSLDKLILTSSPQVICENLNFTHPILKILLEFLQKTKKMGDGDRLFIETVGKLVDEMEFLLENGIKPKIVSNTLKDISLDRKKFATASCNLANSMANLRLGNTMKSELREYIGRIIGDETVLKVLIDAIEYTQSFDNEKIRICKVGSGSLSDSYRMDGMLIPRLPEGCISSAVDTSVGIFNCAFDINRSELKGTVLMKNSTELLNFSRNEADDIKKLIDSLNVNVLIVSGTVNTLFVELADARNLLILRVFNKYDLKRLCDLLGGSIYTSLGPISMKGHVERIDVVQDGGAKFTRVVASGQVTTIVIKNAMKELCDEMERKIIMVLDNLQLHSASEDLLFTGTDFFQTAAKCIGTDTAVSARISKAIESMSFPSMIAEDAIKCMKYAFEFLATILEVDDYLIAKPDPLDVKPRDNPHWDDD